MPSGIGKLRVGTTVRTVFLSGLLAVLSTGGAQAQFPPPPKLPPGSPQAAGQQVFATRCAPCHGTNGMGGEFAPSIVERVPLRTDDELIRLLHSGLPSSRMPSSACKEALAGGGRRCGGA